MITYRSQFLAGALFSNDMQAVQSKYVATEGEHLYPISR